MKTTVRIADALFLEAKQVAKEENTTLRALVEDGLRWVLSDRRRSKPFRLQDASVDGNGFTPEWEQATWEEKLEIMYGDRA